LQEVFLLLKALAHLLEGGEQPGIVQVSALLERCFHLVLVARLQRLRHRFALPGQRSHLLDSPVGVCQLQRQLSLRTAGQIQAQILTQRLHAIQRLPRQAALRGENGRPSPAQNHRSNDEN
jgi:hypothetical protein